MNPTEIRELLSANDRYYYDKEERFSERKNDFKKKKRKRNKREKVEWKRR